ncbi:hypothetical protein PDK10_27545, partial [Bacillus cereus]|nr:hypothetical protein [Bacillus cereus]
PCSRDAIAKARSPIVAAIVMHSNIGFDAGPISAAVFALNTIWRATLLEVNPLLPETAHERRRWDCP